MTELLLISSALQTLLGGALYALWRLQGQPHVRLWAWSNALLGLGLALGVALVDPAVGKLRLELQGLAAATAMSASLYCQLAGAALYSGSSHDPASSRAMAAERTRWRAFFRKSATNSRHRAVSRL